MRLLLAIGVIVYSSLSLACQFAEPIACKHPTLNLHKKSFVQLKEKIKNYSATLGKYSKVSRGRCSKASEIQYQIRFIEKYAEKNNNYFCEEHVKVMILQSESFIDLQSPDHKGIKNENAKLKLIDSGMDVSEALVYYKNKHPLF
jgi:hypothetical protein